LKETVSKLNESKRIEDSHEKISEILSLVKPEDLVSHLYLINRVKLFFFIFQKKKKKKKVKIFFFFFKKKKKKKKILSQLNLMNQRVSSFVKDLGFVFRKMGQKQEKNLPSICFRISS